MVVIAAPRPWGRGPAKPLFGGLGAWEDECLDARLREFLCSLLTESGLSDRSILCARYSLREYVGWLGERDATWQHADCALVRAYLWWAAEALACSTVVLRQWTLRRLFAWARRQGLDCVDASVCEMARRTPARCLRYVPSHQTVQRLLAQPVLATATGVRDRAILEVLYATGLRASELVNLCLHQIDWRERSIQLIGKGGVERIVVVGLPALDALDHYLRGARSAILAAAGFARASTNRLFVHRGREPGLRYDQLRRIVRVIEKLQRQTAHDALCGRR